jgi:glutamate-1-semialdehyde 2,1-aminomutase
LPLAAYGGRRDLMQRLAPEGPVYQAGTLSGNPLAVRAGLETLGKLEAPGFYDKLNARASSLVEGLNRAIADTGAPAQITSAGSLLTIFFNRDPIRNYEDAKASDTKRFGAFFREMLSRGVLLPPSQFESLFVSAAHTEEDIARTVAAGRESLRSACA